MKKYPKDYIKNEKQRRDKQLKDCDRDLSLIIENLHWIKEREQIEEEKIKLFKDTLPMLREKTNEND